MAEATTYPVDPTKTRRTIWDITLGTNQMGGLDDVQIDTVLLLEPVKIGSLGKMKVDDRVIGLEDAAKIIGKAREATITRMKALCPWMTGGNVDLVPPINSLMANAYASVLILHPHDLPLATTTEDLYFFKAVPMKALNLSRDNQKDDLLTVEFWIYPDPAKLNTNPPTNPYGVIGRPA